MKPFRLTRLVLALTPLCLAALPQRAAAQTPGAVEMRLPPGAPPPTPAQNQQFIALNTQFNQDIQALRTNRSLTPAQKQAKAQQLALALNTHMMALLTPAQRAVVMKDRTKIVGLRQTFMKQHQAEIAQAKKLGQEYQKSFTAAQKQKIASIQRQAQTQLQKLQSDPKGTPQTKQATAGAIVRDAQRQEEAVLTPAQRSEITQGRAIQARLQQELADYAHQNGQQ